MKKTKIDWCDSTINCVYGCPNGCKYCYGNAMNKRFHFCKDWKVPEWKPKHIKDFYCKKPKSIFIDSMSDIGTWKQEWFNTVVRAMKDNPQHQYIALTKCYEKFIGLADKAQVGSNSTVRNVKPIETLYVGTSVTTQWQANKQSSLFPDFPDFFSIEPILEPIKLTDYAIPKTLIIGAETGNRKGKVIPQKGWIDSLVKQADEHNCIVFMKESLRKIMGDNFRQDKLLWEIDR